VDFGKVWCLATTGAEIFTKKDDSKEGSIEARIEGNAR
jgi:hypothetical protein